MIQRQKKLLVLGGTHLSCEIIKAAQEEGIYVLVTDYLEDSPGKLIANESFMVSTTDVDGVVDLIREEGVDGVITGFMDSMLPYYEEICRKANLPCYITKEQVSIFTDKQKFKRFCEKFGIPTVEEYDIPKDFTDKDLDKIKFPVILKPVDNSGGRGIKICKRKEDFIDSYNEAQTFSKSGEILVERYLRAREVSIFYIIQDGEIYLSAMADRYLHNVSEGMGSLPYALVYPSKHLEMYRKTTDPKVKKMIRGSNIKNGLLFIQAFFKEGKFFLYDPGFRLTGSLEYYFLEKYSSFNSLKHLIHFAINGKMSEDGNRLLLDAEFPEFACSYTFLIKDGKIGKIKGVREAASLPGVLKIVSSYKEGDIISEKEKGSLRQVAFRIVLTAKDKNDLTLTIKEISNTIKVYSDTKENMALDVDYFK